MSTNTIENNGNVQRNHPRLRFHDSLYNSEKTRDLASSTTELKLLPSSGIYITQHDRRAQYFFYNNEAIISESLSMAMAQYYAYRVPSQSLEIHITINNFGRDVLAQQCLQFFPSKLAKLRVLRFGTTDVVGYQFKGVTPRFGTRDLVGYQFTGVAPTTKMSKVFSQV